MLSRISPRSRSRNTTPCCRKATAMSACRRWSISSDANRLCKGAVMIKLSRLGHATFETPDIEKAIEHHTQVIGLSLVARERDRAYLATRLGQLAVEFVRSNEPKCAKSEERRVGKECRSRWSPHH